MSTAMGWSVLSLYTSSHLNPCSLRTCFSCCIALPSKHVFEQTATAEDFCLCTNFKQLLGGCSSWKRCAQPLVGSTLGREQNSSNALGVVKQQQDWDTASATEGKVSRELAATGQRQSSLKVIGRKQGGFDSRNGRWPWLWNGCVGSSFAHQATPFLCVCQAQGSIAKDVLRILRYVYSIYRRALSGDEGIDIRHFYGLELEGPRRLCKCMLWPSETQVVTGLAPGVELPIKKASLHSSSQSSPFLLSNIERFVE